MQSFKIMVAITHIISKAEMFMMHDIKTPQMYMYLLILFLEF